MTAAQLATIITKLAQIASLAGSGGGSPSGTVLAFAGAAVPTGYLLCDGAAKSRATFSALFTAIGTTWGAGDGSTTFNVPDLRGRTVIGVGTGTALTARSLADSVGAETVALATGDLAAHTHTVTDPGHVHSLSIEGGIANSDGAVTARGASSNVTPTTITGKVLSVVTGITIANAGSGNAHANVQPSSALNYIIKT